MQAKPSVSEAWKTLGRTAVGRGTVTAGGAPALPGGTEVALMWEICFPREQDAHTKDGPDSPRGKAPVEAKHGSNFRQELHQVALQREAVWRAEAAADPHLASSELWPFRVLQGPS